MACLDPSARNARPRLGRSRSTRLLAGGLAAVLGGCNLVQDQFTKGRTTINGVPPDIELLQDPVAAAQRETALLRALVERAGLGTTIPPRMDEQDWHLVVLAGVRVIDGQCDQYLDALFRFNREQRAGRQGLAATAAAAGSILGLAGAASSAIGITAAAFGLGSSLFDAAVGSVLFTIEPSALRNVVLQGRNQYLAGIRHVRVSTRPAAMIVLQGYLTQCTPAAIEAGINNAANGSPNAVTIPSLYDDPAAALLAAPATQLTFGDQVVQPYGVQPYGAPPSPRGTVSSDPAVPGERRLDPDGVRQLQAFLGVPPDGTLGRPGGATRQAIMEFQRGLAARENIDGQPKWVVDGALTGSTAQLLPLLKAGPGPLRTPFEHAFLGNDQGAPGTRFNTPAAPRMAIVWRRLRMTQGETDPPDDQVLTAIRDRLKALGFPSGTLDSTTWTALKARTIPQAAP